MSFHHHRDAATPAASGSDRFTLSNVVLRIRSSPWASVGVRVGSLAIALVVLAVIGHSVTSAQASVSRSSDDAGVPLPLPPLPIAPSGSAGPAASVEPTQARPTSGTRASESEPVFVNVATADELRRLPGVGPKRAAAILDARRRIGRFQRLEDLLRVKGIGRATLRKWRPLVRLDTPNASDADGGADRPSARG